MARRKKHIGEKRPHVAVMGGVLSSSEEEFAKRLGASLMEDTPLCISRSGYIGRQSNDSPNDFFPAFSYSLAKGAQLALDSRDECSRIFTRIDPRWEDESSLETIGQMVPINGRTAESRQLSTIASSDVLCLGGGGKGTMMLYSFAKGLDRPVLPLPFFNGASRRLWNRYRDEITEKLEIDHETARRWSNFVLQGAPVNEIDQLVREVAQILLGAIKLRCLVFMPFAEHFDWVFENIIRRAAEHSAVEISRLDLENFTGDIADRFAKELHKVDILIAVVTGDNANVHYEIGYAHALEKTVLFLCQGTESSSAPNELPIYIRNHRTIWYPSKFDEEGVRAAVCEVCDAFRSAAVYPRSCAS